MPAEEIPENGCHVESCGVIGDVSTFQLAIRQRMVASDVLPTPAGPKGKGFNEFEKLHVGWSTMLPFIEYEWGAFEQKLSGELKAMFYPCQTVLPGMLARKKGSIVAISSGLSKHSGDGFIAHSSAKAALDSFVRGLAPMPIT
ncbi:MAG: SDR family NAD(P)-dependent oxidoreductase [Deltaproteobacteria bacterium]|nr:SDR family NAD(P)-dependent oxidoreductase [Deltaproteobacteria bacterium]